MGIVIGILLGIFVLSSILLVLIVLAQDDGAEGAGILFGSSVSQQYGVRRGNIVTKTTSVLATSFLVLAFVLAFLFKGTNNASELQKASQETSSPSSAVEWWNEAETEEDLQEENVPSSTLEEETEELPHP